MRQIKVLACLTLLSASSGCTMTGAIWNIFGDHYTGGGTTENEKRHHYEQQIEAAQDVSNWQE